jgi:hypothetical protein
MENSSNSYYTYIYLNSLKPGIFKYGNYEFEYEPFYVGKGKNNRISKGLILKNKKYYKYCKIQNIYENNGKIIKIKLHNKLTENEAYIKEKYLTELIGLKIENKGPLVNLKHGGNKFKMNSKTKNKIRKQLLNYYNENIVTEKTKNLISKKLKLAWNDKEKRKRLINGNKGKNLGRIHNEISKKNMSESHKRPLPHLRKTYILISPNNIEYKFKGKVDLINFINKHKLSVRLLLDNINKDKINSKYSKFEKAKNTNNWKILKFK